MTVKTISLAQEHAKFSDKWSPKRIGRIDGHEIKLAKAEGEFDWHAHPDADEFFLVTRGMLRIDFEDQESIFLGAYECCIIPAGVRHRPVAESHRVHMVLIEKAGVKNTGDNFESELGAEVEDL